MKKIFIVTLIALFLITNIHNQVISNSPKLKEAFNIDNIEILGVPTKGNTIKLKINIHF